MRWLLHAVALTLVATAITSTAAAAPPTGVLPPPATVVPLPGGAFAESMALGPGGALYVSLTTWGEAANEGAIYRIEAGVATEYATVDVGAGLLTGLAFGPDELLYVGVASFAEEPANGVVRIEADRSVTQVLTLPSEVFPNGLAFHDGLLYVTDPYHGAIWRVHPGDDSPPEPWLQDKALAPTKGLGVNGIAFDGDTMALAQYDRGQILTATLSGDAAGPLGVLAQDPALKTADGIAFDPLGNLWVAANGTAPSKSGRIVLVTPRGSVFTLAERVPWLDYPTEPVFTPSGLFVVNGSFDGATPSVVGWHL